MSINNAKVEKYYDGTPDFPAANFSPSYTGGGFTYNFKDGNNCTISAVFDSPEAGDSKTVTVTVTLTGENAEQFVFENGTTTDTFTIGGTIHKAEPDLELSMLKTEFLKGDSLYETLSVTGVMENAEVTYRYAEHPSLIYADNDSNNEVIYSFTQAVDAGEFWAYATTAETANYRAGRSNAVKFTVLDFCTVHFESNGALMPRKVPWGRAYGELPVLSREGYTFDGWFTEAEGGTQIQATDIMPENTVEQTLYAHWTPLHTHVFDQQVQNDETLKTPADCLNDAVYYLSCECGEISTSDTFPLQIPLSATTGAHGRPAKMVSTSAPVPEIPAMSRRKHAAIAVSGSKTDITTGTSAKSAARHKRKQAILIRITTISAMPAAQRLQSMTPRLKKQTTSI